MGKPPQMANPQRNFFPVPGFGRALNKPPNFKIKRKLKMGITLG